MAQSRAYDGLEVGVSVGTAMRPSGKADHCGDWLEVRDRIGGLFDLALPFTQKGLVNHSESLLGKAQMSASNRSYFFP